MLGIYPPLQPSRQTERVVMVLLKIRQARFQLIDLGVVIFELVFGGHESVLVG